MGWEQRTPRTWSKGRIMLFAGDCNVNRTVSIPFLATLYFTSSLSFCNDGYNTSSVCMLQLRMETAMTLIILII